MTTTSILTAPLAAWREARRVERARARGVAAFAASHRVWDEALFDAAMLRRPDAAAALEARDPEGLARSWTQQFAYRDERRRERDVASLAAVAEALFAHIDEEEARLGVGRRRPRRLAAPRALQGTC